MEPSLQQILIQQGIGGLVLLVVIYLLVIPFFNWMKAKIDKESTRNDEKDNYLRDLVQNHLVHDHDLREKMIQSFHALQVELTKIPTVTVDMISKQYPPGDVQLALKAAKKIINGNKKRSPR